MCTKTRQMDSGMFPFTTIPTQKPLFKRAIHLMHEYQGLQSTKRSETYHIIMTASLTEKDNTFPTPPTPNSKTNNIAYMIIDTANTNKGFLD